ncbi:D-psicose/D-tagatose/L-ribulose 3-epimerase [Saccharopolyspora lacisalsi]|uniref:D-psicose/D-tagatose/L-ribulose 3-epimerase n=1 Tax=Halosaccharopolyspora lacisalsi TaxID=1000566 RepID=A0A839DUT6_9PSEU|nr:sugar phosphate isomerase/epimerase [Halosaccharopolyspora lacisalsi]MBA8824519.1 D-psicose/D-tagatose/L-ribulose 3-epimerase [Halosaccharopolyspora lacisalsi]
MNPLGIHAGVWVGGWSPEETRLAVSRTAEAGYDLIELTATDPSGIDTKLVRDLLDEHGLTASASLGLTFDADVNNEDTAVVRRGRAKLGTALELVARIGSTHLVGALYSALGKYSAPATKKARANSVAAIRELAGQAADSGVTLGLEIVNRYESNLLNTTRQALEFLDEVDAPNVLIHLDTYHMNIEEGDFARPVREAADRLGYVHVGESHRGYPGSGTIDFATFFRALVDAGYEGPVTFESFSSAVVDPALSSTLAVWRDLWDDNEDLAHHAHRYITDGLHAARWR